MFMDPFSHGYAQEMLLKALQPDRPSDILLQFRPQSICKALTKKKVSQSVLALFGERLSLIQGYCRKEKDNTKREEFMVQHLHSLLRAQGLFTLLFRINQPGTGLADHYALFVTQNAISYNGYKRTILPYSDYQKDGVPLLVANQGEEAQLSLFPQQARYTVALLREELAENATAYKFKSVEKVFELHSPNTPYTPENYLAAFERLRDAGNVELLNGKTLQTVRKATLTSVVKFLV